MKTVKKKQPGIYCWTGVLWTWSSLVILAGTAPSSSAPQKPRTADQCFVCHHEMGGPLADPIRQTRGDVHDQRGLGCVDCHGGDPTHTDAELAMDPKRGFVGKPKPASVPGFCGKCHSDAAFMKKYNPAQRIDQESEYATSGHGQSLRAGNNRVATCVSCHGSHGIRPHTEPQSSVYPTNVARTCGKCHANPTRMGHGISTAQLKDYEASVHAEALNKNDLSAPTCNDCHGNHGATPPGVRSIANVCGTCHTRQAVMFRKSAHAVAFQEMDQAECTACHSNHKVLRPDDKLLGSGESSSCSQCHAEGDRGFQVGRQMHASITGLENRLAQARILIDRAGNAGMEVSRAEFAVAEGHDALINARVLVHTFSTAELKTEADRGMAIAEKSRRMGQQALKDLQFRRKGLGLSLVIILLALIAVYTKIQQIERPEK